MSATQVNVEITIGNLQVSSPCADARKIVLPCILHRSDPPQTTDAVLPLELLQNIGMLYGFAHFSTNRHALDCALDHGLYFG